MKFLGLAFEQIRRERGLSRSGVGRRAGLSQGFLAAFAAGKRGATYTVLARMEEALGERSGALLRLALAHAESTADNAREEAAKVADFEAAVFERAEKMGSMITGSAACVGVAARIRGPR